MRLLFDAIALPACASRKNAPSNVCARSLTTRNTKHLHPVFRYWGGAANLYDASMRRVDWRVFLYLGTWIQERGKSRMTVLRDKDTRMWQITYVSILAPGYKHCAFSVFRDTRESVREPGARTRRISIHKAALWLLFTDMADETPTRRERYSHKSAVPFLVAISIKTPYMRKFEGSPLCSVGRIANLPLGPANCTMPPFAYQHPSHPKIPKTSKTFCLQRHWQ